MINEINVLKNKFYDIKKRGWIESVRNDCGGIGITFENLIGIPANEFEIPDFGQIEIKTKTLGSDSYTTLFNCVPTGPHYHEVKRLKDSYGYPDSILKDKKVLNAIINCIYEVKIGLDFYLIIRVDRKKQKLFLLVLDRHKNLIEKKIYWDFDILEEKLNRKLKYLAIITAKKKVIEGKKHFNYNSMKILKLKNFETFIELIEKGIIRVSFKLGVFRSGNRIGKIHDRGVSFSIKEEDLTYLFETIATFN